MTFIHQSKTKIAVVGSLAVLLVLGGLYLSGFRKANKLSPSGNRQVSSEVTVTANINRQFEFKGINSRSLPKKLTITLVNIERKNEIKVQKETRKANKGKDFLLFRIEIQNTHPEKIALVTSNYIRLEGENGKLFAPDYHNGNVVIDPISTRRDTVVFTVDSSIKSFVFQVGELEGEKQKIEVNF